MTIVTCTQPILFPPLYMLTRIAVSDITVAMVEAQHSRKAQHSWFPLRSPDGSVEKISLSCFNKGQHPINSIEIVDLGLSLNQIEKALWYRRSAPFYKVAQQHFLELLGDINRPQNCNLARAAMHTMNWACEAADIEHRIFASTSILPERPKDPTRWLSDMSAILHATHYFQGEGAKNYFTPGYFKRHNIQVWLQQARYPMISVWGTDVNPANMSCLDILLHAGPDFLREVCKGRELHIDGYRCEELE